MVGLRLGRQFGGDARVGLLAAQEEGPDQAGEPFDRFVVGEPGGRTGVLDDTGVPGPERLEGAEQSGVVQSSRAQSSERLFSTGVPVRATLAGAGMVRSAFAVEDWGFFTCWASSATISPQPWPASCAALERIVP